MSLNIRKIDPENPDPGLLDVAAGCLSEKGLVIAPTETRYGLLARADSAETVAAVYNIKGRIRTSPMAVFVRDAAEVFALAEKNEITAKLAERLLPGPLTLVCRAKPEVLPQMVSGGRIGIRYSSSPVIAGIMKRGRF